MVIIAINLGIGILPHVDNFAHIGGFLTGFLIGFVLMPRPRFGWLEQPNIPARVNVKSKYKAYQYMLWLLSLVLLIVGQVIYPNRSEWLFVSIQIKLVAVILRACYFDHMQVYSCIGDALPRREWE